jgi:hypothetical protein
VFTARYALSPYIKQTRFVFKGLISPKAFCQSVVTFALYRMWMQTACRDLTNYQWRLVCNAVGQCSLPIFVKLVFAEICRWRSYTKPQDTYLASTVMDSIMLLFERVEKQVSTAALGRCRDFPESRAVLRHTETPKWAPKVKRPKRVTKHSPPCGAGAKRAWSSTSILLFIPMSWCSSTGIVVPFKLVKSRSNSVSQSLLHTQFCYIKICFR